VNITRGCGYRTSPETPSSNITTYLGSSGYLELLADNVPGLTVGVVREIFGTETRSAIDHGNEMHSTGHTPKSKGSLTYENPASSARSDSRIERSTATFYVKLNPPPTTRAERSRATELTNVDEVVRVSIANLER
jgi:hypothetical protein